MIELTRKQIHFIRSTLRQTLGITSAKKAPSVTLRATPVGLLIQSASDTVAIEHRIEGDFRPEVITLPYEALQSCEGKQNDNVGIQRDGDTITVQWLDGGIPQSAQYSHVEPVEIPESPAEFTAIDRAFIPAMVEAVATTDNESTRHALGCVRLRGSDGQIAATDRYQILTQSGFSFPWDNDVLVPAMKAFGSKAFRDAADVSIGRSDDWVSIQAGDWTLHLKIEKDARFPNVDEHVVAIDTATTTMNLADSDAEFLAQATRKLPAASEFNAPVTVDLNGSVAIRAKSADQEVGTELILSNSQRSGEELRFNTNRDYLRRAATLGFRQVHLQSAEAPAFCRDDRRAYIWALLGSDGAITPDAKLTRIESPSNSPTPTPRNRTTNPMPNSKRPTATRPKVDKPVSVLAKAEALRDSLTLALADTRDLISAIKARRKQNRLVETTLRSLKQLENIGA
ncbi:MAG: hypothetical protein KDA88_22235 [Planctomycetaceae bacterium]|nr:hypothetical protein [Planctomycetaceae bacterium]MCB9951643.1 hypothetical protein [Planctomycetaceae bacterium]